LELPPAHRTGETRIALREWLEREQDTLEALGGLSLTDSGLAEHNEDCERLYSSLIALRDSMGGARIPTMGDAAASKILHLMVPPLFVMWDKEIKKAGWRYGEFLLQMQPSQEAAREVHRRVQLVACMGTRLSPIAGRRRFGPTHPPTRLLTTGFSVLFVWQIANVE
jgi:hypothetical protein